MSMTSQAAQYASRRVTRRLYRTIPWFGAVIALLTLGQAIRRKGLLRGSLDTALDFTPVVGSVKNMAEVGRGRLAYEPGQPNPLADGAQEGVGVGHRRSPRSVKYRPHQVHRPCCRLSKRALLVGRRGWRPRREAQ